MRYRSRSDIVSSILEAAQEGAMKTQIMYKAFMSSSQLKEYIEFLMDNDLLEYSPETRLFHTTEKGRRFTQAYGEVGQLFHADRRKMVKFLY